MASLTATRDSSSAGTFTSQTWEVAFTTAVEVTSFVADIFQADTYTLKIDGVSVATQVCGSSSVANTWTPSSPVALAAGVHTFQLIGTAPQRYYYISSHLTQLTGNPEYGVWGVWQESGGSLNAVPGTINFNVTGTSISAGMQRNTSSGTARSAQTWSITTDEVTHFKRYVYMVKDADTYKLQIDGVDVVTGVTGTADRIAVFEAASPVLLSTGAHTFKIVPTANRNYRFRGTTNTLIGTSHVTAWGAWTEVGGSNWVAGLVALQPPADGTLTMAGLQPTATLSASYMETVSATLGLTGITPTASLSADYVGPTLATLEMTGIAVTASLDATFYPSYTSAALDLTNIQPQFSGRIIKRVFRPPITTESSDDFFFGRYQMTVGQSVLWDGTTFVTTPYPWLGEIADLEEGVTWFQGGRDYDVSLATATALEAAGYSLTEV